MASVENESGLHRVVVVGGGAAGLQLVTKLGDKLGRGKRAHVTLVDRARTPYLEAAAPRGGGRQPRRRPPRGGLPAPRPHARLPLPDRADDRARPGGAHDPARRELRRGRARGHARARRPLRHAGDGGGLHHQRFRHAGRRRARHRPRHPGPGGALPPASGERLSAGAHAGRPGPARAAPRHGDRRGRDRDGARRRAAPDPAPRRSPPGSTRSTRARTSASPWSRPPTGSCRRCRSASRRR